MTNDIAQWKNTEVRSELLKEVGDLDKVDVLFRGIPTPLYKTDFSLFGKLEAVLAEAGDSRGKVAAVLKELKAPRKYCAEELRKKLTEKFGMDLDLDVHLDVIRLTPRASADKKQKTYSLLQAAMHNFTAAEAGKDFYSADSGVLQDGTVVPAITVTKFAELCRELDLGKRYQAYFKGVLDSSTSAEPLSFVSNFQRLTKCDLKAAAYIAYMKKHIGKSACEMLQSLADTDGDVTEDKRFNGEAVKWEGMKIFGWGLSGVVVFSFRPTEASATDSYVMYVPNDPYVPLYECASIEECKTYRLNALQVKGYAEFFVRFLDEAYKVDFLSKAKGTLETKDIEHTQITIGLFKYIFESYINKYDTDVQRLVVPSADVDGESQAARREAYGSRPQKFRRFSDSHDP